MLALSGCRSTFAGLKGGREQAGTLTVTPMQYPMTAEFHNPVELLSMPDGKLEKLVVKISGVKDMSKVGGLRLWKSDGWMNGDYVAPDKKGIVTITDFSSPSFHGGIEINCWLSGVEIGSRINFKVLEAVVDGKSLKIEQDTPLAHYPGIVVNTGGDIVGVRGDSTEVVTSFRIPALVTSNSGTLIAAYDVRYKGWGDLQADIDVGVKRSTDGGKTWSELIIAMDMGEYGGLPESENGIGDPCLLVDELNGDILCFAVWTNGHGSDPDRRSLAWAGTGFDITDTPQLLMVRSCDDGLTWSAPVNITAQIKQPHWRMTFQGPGRGITMKDGTLVIPIQHQEGESRSMHGLYPLNSGIAYSTDHGNTWHAHGFAHSVTSEAAVAEIEPGVLLLTMRDESDSRYRRNYITTDLGRSWKEHVSNGKLYEPTCEASLLQVKSRGKDILLFSNPQTVSGWRDHITIQASLDGGASWNHRLLLDAGGSLGYSCLTMVDENTVGILYESSKGNILFQAIPLADILK